MDNRKKQEYLKIAVYGSRRVGASRLMDALSGKKFQETKGFQFLSPIEYQVRRYLENNDATYLIVLNEQKYNPLKIPPKLYTDFEVFMETSSIIFLVIDMTSKHSFEEASSILKRAQSLKHESATITVVGTKSDLTSQHEVTSNEIRKFAEENKLPFFITSAKTGNEIDDLLLATVNQAARLADNMTFTKIPPNPKTEEDILNEHKIATSKFIDGLMERLVDEKPKKYHEIKKIKEKISSINTMDEMTDVISELKYIVSQHTTQSGAKSLLNWMYSPKSKNDFDEIFTKDNKLKK